MDWCAPPSGASETRTACRPGWTGRPRRCRTTTAPAPAPTNGSYSTPTGNSGCPCLLQVAPSSPSSPTRLVSAMPSSMCCPVGFSRQCRMVSASSANQSVRSRADHTPTLFTQPPRLVLELTSGLTVTTRLAASGASRVRSSRARPSAAWVVAVPDGVRPRSCGTAGGACRGEAGRRSRAAVCAHSPAAALSGAGRCQGWPGSAPACAASSASWASVSSAEWFCGMPLDGQAVALDRVGQDDRGRLSSMAL